MKLLKGLPINPAAFKVNPAAFKGIAATLRQPQWVAVMASVGFHGALFAVGPSFSNMQGMALGAPGFGDTVERRVPMVELTAEEQSRLPNFNSPAYSLLPGDLLPGEFPPSNSSNLMDLFPPSGNRPNLPSLPPLPEGLSAVPRIPPSRSSLGSPVTVSPFPSRLGRNSVVIPTPPSSGLGRPRPNDSPDADPPTPNPGNRPPADDATASTPTSTPAPAGRAEDLLPQNGETANRDSAPLQARDDASEDSPTVSPEVARSRELMARVAYSEDLTTPEESEAAAVTWANALTDQLGEPVETAEATFAVEVPYDLRLCLNPEPSTGLLGFALMPKEGTETVDIATTVIKSTGYPFLNQAAIQSLQTLAANSETPLALGTIYQAVITVIYDGDDCIEAATLLKSRLDASEAASSPETPETPPKPEN